MKRQYFCFLALFALVGCSALGILPAKTFEDRAGQALGIHTAVLNSVTYTLDNQQITSAEAEDVLEIADNAREFVDTARQIRSLGDEAAADKTLAMATAILRKLQEYVKEKQP